jgi:hypothetical protein
MKMKRRNKGLALKCIIVCVAFCLVSVVAQANIVNGSFEDGLTGWSSSRNIFFTMVHHQIQPLLLIQISLTPLIIYLCFTL